MEEYCEKKIYIKIITISSTLTACGGKKVTKVYKKYIIQAKVEIVNGDYDKAYNF